DMHGNVWEFCEDVYGIDYYKNSPIDDPPGPGGIDPGDVVGGRTDLFARTKAKLVRRGGSWRNKAEASRSAVRYFSDPRYGYFDFGFRLALSIDAPKFNAPPPPSTSTDKEPKHAIPPDDDWIDLLSLVDIERDALEPGWRKDENGVWAAEGTDVRLALPVEVRGGYELLSNIVVEARDSGAMAFNIPVGSNRAELILGVLGKYHALHLLAGQAAHSSKNKSRVERTLETGKAYELHLRVQLIDLDSAEIVATLDDMPLISWRGDPKDLSLSAPWDGPANRLGLRVGRYKRVRWESVQLRLLGDEPEFAPHSQKIPNSSLNDSEGKTTNSTEVEASNR
ncbi:MAG: SUMF1/EgtB/PvdO family nonheme iron enzyme, partial [Planctomycetales bacterium]|nr:SUMF1/EgtB/PvdO family nonheme iron enzyme [Planctomycetales bacterium]